MLAPPVIAEYCNLPSVLFLSFIYMHQAALERKSPGKDIASPIAASAGDAAGAVDCASSFYLLLSLLAFSYGEPPSLAVSPARGHCEH